MPGGAEMIGPPGADDANALLARLAHGDFHRDHADPLARAVVAIDLCGTGRLALDLDARARIDLARRDPQRVARDADHVVRWLAAQACLELHFRHDLGAFAAQSRAHQCLAAIGAEAFDRHQRSRLSARSTPPRPERSGWLQAAISTDHTRKLGDRLMLIELAQIDLQTGLLRLEHDIDAQPGIAAEVKEIVADADAVQAQDLLPDLRENLLHVGTAAICAARLPSRTRHGMRRGGLRR